MAATKRPLVRSAPIVRRGDRATRSCKLAPAPHGAEPGDVRRAGRQRAHDARARARRRDRRRADVGFTLQLALWLWFTVLFANFAEAMAEGRGKAQADALRKTRTETTRPSGSQDRRDHLERRVACSRPTCRTGDLVLVQAGRPHPGRRRGRRGRRLGGRVGDHRRVRPGHPRVRRRPLGGHRRHQGAVRLARRPHHAPNPGETFLDRMIALVEGAVAAEDAERDRAHDPARPGSRSSSARRA